MKKGSKNECERARARTVFIYLKINVLQEKKIFFQKNIGFDIQKRNES